MTDQKPLAAPEARDFQKLRGDYPAFDETQAKAEDLLDFFMLVVLAVRRILWTDIDAAFEGDPAAKSYEEIILAYPALEAIAIYRMAHLLYLNTASVLPAHHDRMGA